MSTQPASEIKDLGRKVMTYGADVSNSDQVHGMIKRTLENFGSSDLLVNNESVFKRLPFERLNESIWEVIKTHTRLHRSRRTGFTHRGSTLDE